MWKKLLKNRLAVIMLCVICFIFIVGIFAPFFAPHDPYKVNILEKYAKYSRTYPLGTDNLGRCILSRMIYGIRPTLFLSMLTMIGTISIGTVMGLLSGYFRGIVDEIIMRLVDVMLSFPSQIMVFAIVALLGVDVKNVILANILIKWAWYARMIRGNVMKYRDKNYVLFSRTIGNKESFILFRHLLPSISSEMVVLATLDIGWAILNISTLSFLGLGVQAPNPEWGAMLNEAKNVLTTNPIQMIAPGIAIVILVSAFNFLGDALRDALDPKEGGF
jgi:nickel transport system permease protein